MKVTPLETLLAAKVINLEAGLSQSDQRVGLVLLEHFNRKSGRCDPSIERIARLLGCSERTVIRSIKRLERLGLFRRVRHGGYSHRNSYEPNWPRFAELVAAWKRKFQRMRPTKLSLSDGPPGHIASDTDVTQTCLNNLQILTCFKRNSNEAKRVEFDLRISRPISNGTKSTGPRSPRGFLIHRVWSSPSPSCAFLETGYRVL